MPEDVTALAEREGLSKDRETVKKSVSKNYHKLKDLISSKFKKDSPDGADDELNNVASMLQHQLQQQQDSLGSSFLMPGVSQGNNLSHAQSNINLWSSNTRGESPLYYHKKFADPADGYNADSLSGFRSVKAVSQPQLNTATIDINRPVQNFPNQMDGTDSDDGGFRQHNNSRVNVQAPVQQHSRQLQQNYVHNYRHNHPQSGQLTPQMTSGNYQHTPQSRHKILAEYSDSPAPHQQQQLSHGTGHMTINIGESSYNGHEQMDKTQNQMDTSGPSVGPKPMHKSQPHVVNGNQNNNNTVVQIASDSSHVVQMNSNGNKQIDSISSSDYDRNGNHSSNVDSGRGSAAYSSGRKGAVQQQANMSMTEPVDRTRSKSESEWVSSLYFTVITNSEYRTFLQIDVVDAELRNILEPGIKGMMIRPESTMSESASSMSPPLPPLSPDGGTPYHTSAVGGPNTSHNRSGNSKHQSKQEYGTDTYNRASKNPQPIGPSKGQPSVNTIQNYMHNLKLSSSSKKHEQNMLKKHRE